MRQTIGLWVATSLLLMAFCGCGFTGGNLSRAPAEQPSAAQGKWPHGPTAADAVTAPESVAAGARAVEDGKPTQPGTGPADTPPSPRVQDVPRAQDDKPQPQAAAGPAPAAAAPRPVAAPRGGGR